MNIIADTSARSLKIAAPFAIREQTLDLRVYRADDLAWITETSGNYYRLSIQRNGTLLAAVDLTLSDRTLSGTLTTNTAEAIAAFSAVGNPANLEAEAVLRLMTSAGVPVREIGRGRFDLLFAPEDGGDPISATVWQDGSDDLIVGQDYVDVTFDTAFASAPTVVTASVEKPSADAANVAVASISNKTVSGFRANLNAAPSVSGYSIGWYARA